jgi:hypothetical protein
VEFLRTTGAARPAQPHSLYSIGGIVRFDSIFDELSEVELDVRPQLEGVVVSGILRSGDDEMAGNPASRLYPSWKDKSRSFRPGLTRNQAR